MRMISKDSADSNTLHYTSRSFSGLASLVNEIIDNVVDEILNSIGDKVKSFFHWLMHCLFNRKERTNDNNNYPIIVPINIPSCVKPKIIAFFNVSQNIRNVYLLRPRPRGSDDDFALIISCN